MPNLAKMAKAVKTAQQPVTHSILLYGPPKTGKTRLAATAAAIDGIERIFWFDLENGISTVMNMGLSEEALSKITLFSIQDTRKVPNGISTILRAFSSTNEKPAKICVNHGAVDCPICKKDKEAEYDEFSMEACTKRDLVVIDSLSQLGASALNLTMLGRDSMAKAEFDDWGAQGKFLTDIHLHIQSAAYTNFLCVTHELHIDRGEKIPPKIVPQCGTRNVSNSIGKYYGSVVYLNVRLKKYTGISQPDRSPNITAGSRLDVDYSKENLTMEGIFKRTGIIPDSTTK